MRRAMGKRLVILAQVEFLVFLDMVLAFMTSEKTKVCTAEPVVPGQALRSAHGVVMFGYHGYTAAFFHMFWLGGLVILTAMSVEALEDDLLKLLKRLKIRMFGLTV